MRPRDDHAATNQQAIHALSQARRRAVAECQSVVYPRAPASDRVLTEGSLLLIADDWDGLEVGYLRAEWPPSMLS